jgi:hypothetical protein
MKVPTLAKLLEDQLKDLYSAETRLTKERKRSMDVRDGIAKRRRHKIQR